jgi:hypothetical protein
LLLIVVLSAATTAVSAEEGGGAVEGANPYAAWKNGPGTDPDFFPIAVWLQAPTNAPRYKALGVNLYVGLWRGPTAEQIAELKKHGMRVICGQNDYALRHLDSKTIVGWMHGDEPDNAQSLGRGKGYGPPIPPKRIVDDYERIKAKDPSRPILLNLGQGVAWDGWHGRGVRTNHPEDYPEYVQGCDVISFDIYPAVHDKPAVAGKLWYVARGVDRLRTWTGSRKVIWNCIECTHIGNPDTKPTPDEVKAEVWMSIIYGSRGLIYFCHQFQPRFIEAGLLADREMAEAVGRINQQIHELASVINGPTLDDLVTVRCDPADVSPELAEKLPTTPVAITARKDQGAVYIFSVGMEARPVRAEFRAAGVSPGAAAEVLGEDRTIRLENGRFEDQFEPYAVHLYKIQ